MQKNELEKLRDEEVKIYNLSVKEIAHRTSDTVHNIMDDVLTYNTSDGFRGFLHIFTRSDRLMYQAKKLGKDRFHYYKEHLSINSHYRLQMESLH